ncbi:sulfotransferase family protein [Undibacterium flavidum]|uniref:Sulfotransferase family protein n=1 Tax=Undibacterium flavidum TaxID=2762297 RepID=A0ABR6Y8G1_9BURK|nr:hypothetical protein [Undibacterium flavidum]MBC3872929.1 hypothetical protein [Undibacterium flavidum]
MQAYDGFVSEERSFIRGEPVDSSTLDSLRNWYPITFCHQSNELYWRDMGQQRFVESFFQNSLNTQPRDQRRVCRTPVSALSQFTECVAPTAFIFHVSRCGSTLLTQMFSHLAQCIVLSEPPVIDAFFRVYSENSPESILIFQQLIAALGQRRAGEEKHFIVKFDSWHISRLAFIRKAFPQTPLLFLYRDPQQVLASHQRQRGPQMIPGFVNLGNICADLTDLMPGDLDGYCLRVLDQFYTCAISHHLEHDLRLLNYHELPALVWESLLSQLNLSLTLEELEQVKARSQYHSKHPQQNFLGDPQAHVKHACSDKTEKLYLQLEKLRQQANSTK